MQVQKDQKKVVRCTTIKSGFTFYNMKWPVEFIRKVGLFYIPPFFLSKQATSKRRKNCKSSCCCLFPLPQIVEQSRAKKCKRLQKKVLKIFLKIFLILKHLLEPTYLFLFWLQNIKGGIIYNRNWL
jgi:hypothetical protein